MTAPVWSVTVPRMRPKFPCASREKENSNRPRAVPSMGFNVTDFILERLFISVLISTSALVFEAGLTPLGGPPGRTPAARCAAGPSRGKHQALGEHVSQNPILASWPSSIVHPTAFIGAVGLIFFRATPATQEGGLLWLLRVRKNLEVPHFHTMPPNIDLRRWGAPLNNGNAQIAERRIPALSFVSLDSRTPETGMPGPRRRQNSA